MKALVRTPKSQFLRVACKKCKNEQVVFSKASTAVKCSACGEELVIPTGGNALIKARVLEALG